MADAKDRTTFVVIALKNNRELDIQLGTGTTQSVVAGERVKLEELKIGEKYEGFVNGKYLNYVFATKFNKNTSTTTQATPTVSKDSFKPSSDGTVTVILTKDQAYELEKLLDKEASLIRTRTMEVMRIPMTIKDLRVDTFISIFDEQEAFITKYIKPITKQLESYRGKQ